MTTQNAFDAILKSSGFEPVESPNPTVQPYSYAADPSFTAVVTKGAAVATSNKKKFFKPARPQCLIVHIDVDPQSMRVGATKGWGYDTPEELQAKLPENLKHSFDGTPQL